MTDEDQTRFAQAEEEVVPMPLSDLALQTLVVSHIKLTENRLQRIEFEITALNTLFNDFLIAREQLVGRVVANTDRLDKIEASSLVPNPHERRLSTLYTTILALVGINISLTVGTLWALVQHILTTPR